MTQSYAAALFDMDGLLLDSERVYYETYQDTRRTLGLGACHDSYVASIGLRMAQARPLFAAALDGVMPIDQFEDLWSQAIDQRFAADVPLRPNVKTVLQTLQNMGLPLAVVTSSGGDHAQHILDRAGILNFFNAVVAGDHVGHGKPHPEPYLTAAAKLGVDIKCCAAFEDSDVGIRAALASGARSVQVPDLKPPSEDIRAMGHVIAPDLLSGAKEIGLISGAGQLAP